MPPKKELGVAKRGPGQQEFNQAQLLEFIHQDYKLAGRYYEKACSAGHPMAQYHYGLWFLQDAKPGRVKPDEIRARKLFQAAAGKEIGIAQVALAQMHECGSGGLAKNVVKAFELYKKAVKNPATLSKENIEKICLRIDLMYMNARLGTCKDLNETMFQKTEDASSAPQNTPFVFAAIKEMLAQGIHRQKEADKKWSVMCDYLDKLPEEEKPKTFKAWENVMRKCGYQVHDEYLEKSDDEQCNFQEFMELCGGSFTNLESYELQDYLSPKRKCGHCNKEEGKNLTLRFCSRCAQPYCSKVCQRMDWSTHKPVCNAVYDNI